MGIEQALSLRITDLGEVARVFLVMSILIQFATIVSLAKLIRSTGVASAWIFLLMGYSVWTLKRCYTGYVIYDAEIDLSIINETIFLTTVVLFFLGIMKIKSAIKR